MGEHQIARPLQQPKRVDLELSFQGFQQRHRRLCIPPLPTQIGSARKSQPLGKGGLIETKTMPNGRKASAYAVTTIFACCDVDILHSMFFLMRTVESKR